MVEDLAQELRAASLDAEGVVLTGAPKAVLLEEAERWQADCVFLGSQGLNAVERLMLGSVSTAVAARAACSVEISRR
jgi:nucleotide-binding universal stress UspA family protein